MQTANHQTLSPPVLHTQRLAIRTIEPGDAEAVHRLAGDWQVARMLADMPHPLSVELAGQWTQAAAAERCLAITLDGRMIGSVSAFAIDPSQTADDDTTPAVELGFWLGRPWWGYGYAREAAGAVVTGLTAGLDTARFKSGHVTDNPASGRVLSVLGFSVTGTAQQWCVARQETLPAVRYELPGVDRSPATVGGD